MKAVLFLPAALLVAVAAAAAQPAPSPPSYDCRLTAEDLAANARLSFEDFDQRGTTPATARKLGERGCHAEAARATEDYLLNGPVLDDYQRNVVRWHLGQYLASAGNEQAAARVIASTRRPVDPQRPEFDWNTYVTGVWAFLVRNRPLLEQASARLSAASGRANGLNARILGRLLRCFDQSYRQAIESQACAAPEAAR
jgi:hypothetical protein